MLSALYISHYKNDGFQKVCDVEIGYARQWNYFNIVTSLMFSNHSSWVYFIVLDGQIVKIGETGRPLGIPCTYIYPDEREDQPAKGSKSRLGRYRTGDTTDAFVRGELHESISNGKSVSIWAKKCPTVNTIVHVGNQPVEVSASIHKELEKTYLDYFVNQTGFLPMLNKGRA